MKKVLFFCTAFCATMNFGSDRSLTKNTKKTQSDNVIRPAQYENLPSCWAVMGTIGLLFGIVGLHSLTDYEAMAIKIAQPNCSEPFNETDCHDSDLGCWYKKEMHAAFCNDTNKTCIDFTQVPNCNLTREQRRAIARLYGRGPWKFHKNYSQEDPAGYAQQECWKKRGHHFNGDTGKCEKIHGRSSASTSSSLVSAAIAAFVAWLNLE